MRRVFAGTFLALAAASGARADIRDLAADLEASCRVAPGGVGVEVAGSYGVISAKDVRTALYANYPVTVTAALQLADDSTKRPAERLAKHAIAIPPGAKDDDAALFRIARVVDEWTEGRQPASPVLKLEAGGLRIQPTAGALSREQVLTKIFEGDDSGLSILCRNPTPAAGEAPAKRGPTFVLVRTAEDFADVNTFGTDASITDKSFAEFSYSDDRQTRVQTWAVELAAALRWPEQSRKTRDFDLFWAPSLVVAYERQGENDPDTDGYVNNLNFGVQVDGRMDVVIGGSTWSGYGALTGLYETDDDFESEAYAAQITIDPLLPNSLPFHRTYRGFVREPTVVDADFKWTLDLVADWSDVRDPGRKEELVDRAEYVRLGYDVGFKLKVGPVGKDWRLVLATDYRLRDGRTNDGGDAQLVTSSLNYLASDTTNWSFGLSYERGENLQSFESSELWKLVFGLRF